MRVVNASSLVRLLCIALLGWTRREVPRADARRGRGCHVPCMRVSSWRQYAPLHHGDLPIGICSMVVEGNPFPCLITPAALSQQREGSGSINVRFMVMVETCWSYSNAIGVPLQAPADSHLLRATPSQDRKHSWLMVSCDRWRSKHTILAVRPGGYGTRPMHHSLTSSSQASCFALHCTRVRPSCITCTVEPDFFLNGVLFVHNLLCLAAQSHWRYWKGWVCN